MIDPAPRRMAVAEIQQSIKKRIGGAVLGRFVGTEDGQAIDRHGDGTEQGNLFLQVGNARMPGDTPGVILGAKGIGGHRHEFEIGDAVALDNQPIGGAADAQEGFLLVGRNLGFGDVKKMSGLGATGIGDGCRPFLVLSYPARGHAPGQ